jgi:succinoglycan biosynthesis transport protein ExoP
LFFVTALAVMTIAVVVSYLVPKKYEAKSTVFIEKNVVADLVQGIAVPPSADDSLKVMDYALTSRTLLLKAVNNVDFNLRTQNDAVIEGLIDEIRRNITIDKDKNGKDPNMFIVSFKYTNPRVARDFVNTLVQLFIEQNVSAKRDQSYGANKFLSEEIATYKERLDKAQATINQYKTKQGAAAAMDGDRLMHDIDEAQQRLTELEMRQHQLEEERSYAQNATDPLRVKLTALTNRLNELRTQFTDSYPDIIDLKSQIASLQHQISSGSKVGHGEVNTPQELWKIDAELKAVRESEVTVQHFIEQNRKLLDTLPNTKSAIDKLEAAKDNEQNMYNLLFLRQNQSEISKQMELQDKSTTFRIVDPAVTPLSPVSPNRVRIILMGIAAGFAAGFGVLFAFDYMDNSVKSLDSLKTLGQPVLAVIPLIKDEDEISAEKKRDLRVYVASGCYFSVILLVLLMEMLGAPFVDNVMSRLPVPDVIARVLERLG